MFMSTVPLSFHFIYYALKVPKGLHKGEGDHGALFTEIQMNLDIVENIKKTQKH